MERTGPERLKKPCVVCGTTRSEMWWKCCPIHCTPGGPDYICASCVTEVHGLCIRPDCGKLGAQAIAIKFGIVEDGRFRLYEDKTRLVFLCTDHMEDIIILEPQM